MLIPALYKKIIDLILNKKKLCLINNGLKTKKTSKKYPCSDRVLWALSRLLMIYPLPMTLVEIKKARKIYVVIFFAYIYHKIDMSCIFHSIIVNIFMIIEVMRKLVSLLHWRKFWTHPLSLANNWSLCHAKFEIFV